MQVIVTGVGLPNKLSRPGKETFKALVVIKEVLKCLKENANKWDWSVSIQIFIQRVSI